MTSSPTFHYIVLRGEFDMTTEEEKKFSKQLLGKTVVSKTGKRFGEVGDIIFETRSGELIHLVLANPTSYTEKLELEKDKTGSILIPFSAVIAIGDFMVVAEEDII
jgi:sporulation protein YlmC with PRC-barrel domain